ncbi:MAG: glycosyltransferase [Flavobacteriaceae bacterium]|nr:glycosyltransferase [Flavobacteriaceae bacterium]
MSKQKLDYLIIGPAAPFRGGIADTQNELGEHLIQAGKKIQLLTFSKLYPNLLFPGKNQKRKNEVKTSFDVLEIIHAYNPLAWRKVIRYINKVNPQNLVFRYYTPFLAPVYGWIAKKTNADIKIIALVDNWTPHESTFWDGQLNCYFGKQMDGFTTLSENVALQLQKQFKKPVWKGFHPINTHLLPQIPRNEARKKLGWELDKSVVLFFGLIRPYKGLELLIQAFANKAFHSKNVLLKIVGECYEDTKKYTDLVNKLELENSVEFDFEFKTEPEIQILLSACDIVGQTYHSATQSGVTPLAYFYQKPLIVSDIEGLNTPIKKDQTGICVQKKPQAIAEGIVELLEKTRYQQTIQHLKKAFPRYTWKHWVKNWDGFIQSVKKDI